jgi:cold shock CspA family protein
LIWIKDLSSLFSEVFSVGSQDAVVRIDPAEEFGFLESGDGQEIYFHRNSVIDQGFARLHVGSRVTYTEEMGEKGAQASTVRLSGKHSMKI